MIVACGLSFSYARGTPALVGVDLDVGTGLTLVLGGNGAGKSTLLRLLAGIERPDAGSVSIAGHDPWQDEVRARAALAHVPEQADLPQQASVGEVLRLVARLRGEPAIAADEALELIGLPATLMRRPSRELSTGQARRVHLAAARIGSPSVLLLDEPLEALDRRTRDDVVAWAAARAGGGAAVMIVTDDLEPFVPHATRALALRDGRTAGVVELPANPRERLAAMERLARG